MCVYNIYITFLHRRAHLSLYFQIGSCFGPQSKQTTNQLKTSQGDEHQVVVWGPNELSLVEVFVGFTKGSLVFKMSAA